MFQNTKSQMKSFFLFLLKLDKLFGRSTVCRLVKYFLRVILTGNHYFTKNTWGGELHQKLKVNI